MYGIAQLSYFSSLFKYKVPGVRDQLKHENALRICVTTRYYVRMNSIQ